MNVHYDPGLRPASTITDVRRHLATHRLHSAALQFEDMVRSLGARAQSGIERAAVEYAEAAKEVSPHRMPFGVIESTDESDCVVCELLSDNVVRLTIGKRTPMGVEAKDRLIARTVLAAVFNDENAAAMGEYDFAAHVLPTSSSWECTVNQIKTWSGEQQA